MENIIEELVKKIIKKKAPIVVGLDPVLERIPSAYYIFNKGFVSEKERIAEIIYLFNVDIIDAIYEIVPAIKPQIAFYKMYGSYGIRAFEKTIIYAKQKGLIVIIDGKRNDIGNTAKAYANAHLGKVTMLKGEEAMFDAGFLTVSPYLGFESIKPFYDACKKHGKGIFVLVKTSNKGNEEIQDVMNDAGEKLYENIAKKVNTLANNYYGKSGYSSIGAVVGATYPKEAKKLRKIMPISMFLVPGYGAQGALAKDIVGCFNEDGLGAIISASRSIIFGYEDINKDCSKEEYMSIVKDLTKRMILEIYKSLKEKYNSMIY